MSLLARRGIFWPLSSGILLSLLAGGCLQNHGIDPPTGKLNFPVAIMLIDALDDGMATPTHLVVANSNIDLAYNAATLQSYDLDAFENAITNDCVNASIDGELCSIVAAESGEPSGTRGNVRVVAESGLLASEVQIGSGAEGLVASPSGHRLYIPVRSEADVTRVDFDTSGRLSCGGVPGVRHACDTAHRRTDQTAANLRNVQLPIEPLDIHSGALSDFGVPGGGEYLAVAHRGGQTSFFVVPPGGETPVLTDVMTVTGASFVTLTFDPILRRFWLPTGNGGLFVRATVNLSSSTTDAAQAEWLKAPSVALAHVDTGSSAPSIRQVVIDPRVGTIHEGRFYGVGLRPSALLVGRTDQGSNSMALDAILPLGTQPTRAKFVQLAGRMLAFVSCYLSRDVYVYDVDQARLVTIVRGMSGPFELAIDEARERLFVDDFRVSVVRVFDLAPLIDCLEFVAAPAMEPACSPVALGMLGIPSTVEELR